MTGIRDQGSGGAGVAAPLERLHDWPGRLADFEAGAETRPFAWGWWDCGQALLEAIAAQTDVELPWPGPRYDSEESAAASLEAFAGGDLEAAVALLAGDLGLPEVAPAMAQRGDPCLLRHYGALLCGWLSAHAGEVCTVAPRGLLRLTRGPELPLRAWRLG